MKIETQRDELLLLNLSYVNLAELSEKSSLVIVHEMCGFKMFFICPLKEWKYGYKSFVLSPPLYYKE